MRVLPYLLSAFDTATLNVQYSGPKIAAPLHNSEEAQSALKYQLLILTHRQLLLLLPRSSMVDDLTKVVINAPSETPDEAGISFYLENSETPKLTADSIERAILETLESAKTNAPDDNIRYTSGDREKGELCQFIFSPRSLPLVLSRMIIERFPHEKNNVTTAELARHIGERYNLGNGRQFLPAHKLH